MAIDFFVINDIYFVRNVEFITCVNTDSDHFALHFTCRTTGNNNFEETELDVFLQLEFRWNSRSQLQPISFMTYIIIKQLPQWKTFNPSEPRRIEYNLFRVLRNNSALETGGRLSNRKWCSITMSFKKLLVNGNFIFIFTSSNILRISNLAQRSA